MRYKVGDRVKVVDEFKESYIVNGEALFPNFLRKQLQGKTVTIKKVLSNRYIIEEMTVGYEWTDEMFDGLVSSNTATEIILEGNMDFRIKDYKVINNKVVVVEFADGDVQKAVCMPGDTFNEEQGLEVCLMKHICGGKAKYHKVLKEAQKQIVELDKTAKKKAEEENRLAQKQEKDSAKKAARRERAKQARIAEMKAAYLSALQEYNGDTKKAIEVVES